MNEPAPEWKTSRWFNARNPRSLASLRGQVVALETFQMLCSGCVARGLPQAQRLTEAFGNSLVVVGMHSVFEHHAAMTPVALEAFLSEYRVTFPVGVDVHDASGVPQTMRAYRMRGTPTLTLIDRQGKLRHQWFGHVEDLELGASVAALLAEPKASFANDCTDQTCTVSFPAEVSP
ncbi:MAG: redoxin domain-containing protein [Myxococcota bacterium]